MIKISCKCNKLIYLMSLMEQPDPAARIAEEVGASRDEFELKVNGNEEWLYKEALATADYLKLDLREVFPEHYQTYVQPSNSPSK